MNKAQGTIVNAISGYYDVETENKVVRARACGAPRDRKQKPLVDDGVVVRLDDQRMNYLIEMLPRANKIGRPAVANVSRVLLVISTVEPDFSLESLDKYLTFFAWKNVRVVIHLSKSDTTPSEKLKVTECKLDYYRKTDYSVFEDTEELERQLPIMIQKDQIWTLAGQSGAEKSTLLNKLGREVNQATSAISTVLDRGKHATRRVRLFKYVSGFIADTPGFLAIGLFRIKVDELGNYFYDLKDASVKRKFRRYQHIKKPGCEVKKLIEEGRIAKSRYDSYLKIRQRISENRMPEHLKK